MFVGGFVLGVGGRERGFLFVVVLVFKNLKVFLNCLLGLQEFSRALLEFWATCLSPPSLVLRKAEVKGVNLNRVDDISVRSSLKDSVKSGSLILVLFFWRFFIFGCFMVFFMFFLLF